jgi:hypothetical protein
MTILAQLIASTVDDMGYITYVFKCLEDQVAKESAYIMCTRYPNWNHKKVNLGDIGFLDFNIVVAGKDTWYNGKEQIPYKYNAVQFLKFIEKPKEINHEYIM